MDQKRTIDYLKAFAIILVVFYHAIIALDICYHDLTYICITIALKNIHVPLFLLIAGYLCHKQDIRLFYLKKVRRILIPFLFMTALKLVFSNFLFTEYSHGESIPQQIFDAFLCGQLYWFCYALLIMFVIAPLLWNRKTVKWILLLLSLAANTVLVLNSINLTDILQLHNVLFYSSFFLSGMLLSDYRLQDWTKKRKSICLIIAVIIGVMTGYLRFHDDVHTVYIIDYLFGLSVMYLLYLIAERIPDHGPFARGLSTVGKYSLQIMLLDPFLRISLYLVFSKFMKNGTPMAMIMTVLNVAICCLICFIAEKIPVLSSLLGLKQLKRN